MYWVRIPDMITRCFPDFVWKVGAQEIALTFDDGPDPETTEQLVALLKQQNCLATHFLLGNKAQKYPELVEQIRSAGHAAGHHSFSHPDGWRTGNDIYLEDVRRGYDIVQSPLFRPPYGKIRPGQWHQLKKDHPDMRCILFNLMPGDFDVSTDIRKLRERLYRAKGGDIIVLHDRKACYEKYAEILPEWIQAMREKGLSFVTL